MKKLLLSLIIMPAAYLHAQEQVQNGYVPTLYTLALNATTKKFIDDIQDLSLEERFALANKLSNSTQLMSSEKTDSSRDTVLLQFERLMGSPISQPVSFIETVLDISSDGTFVLTKSSDRLQLGQIILKKSKNNDDYEQALIPIQRYTGHKKVINAAQFVDNNTKILSASNDTSLRLWDIATGKTIHTLEGHTNWVQQCIVSKDQQRALSIAKDKRLIWWDLSAGKAIHTLEGHTKSILHAELSPDGTKAVSCGLDGTINVWNLEDGKLISSLNNTDPVGFTQMSTSGNKILSVSKNCLKLWDTDTNQATTTIKTTGENSHALLTKDGSKIISVIRDNIIVWDAKTGLKIDELTTEPKNGVGQMGVLSAKILYPLLVRNNISIDQLPQRLIKAIPSSVQGYIEPELIHEKIIVKDDLFVSRSLLFKLEKWQSILDSIPRKKAAVKASIFGNQTTKVTGIAQWAKLPVAKK